MQLPVQPKVTRRSRVRAYGVVFRQLRNLGAVRRRRFLLVGVAALVGGIVEASLIFLVIRLALAMSTGETELVVDLGPVHTTLHLAEGFAVCAGLILVSFGAILVTARVAARLAAESTEHARQRTIKAFLSTRWEIQSIETPARLQELLSNHVYRLGNSTTFVTNGLVAGVNFLAFLVTAIVITPLAAVVMGVGMLIFGIVIVPLTKLTRTRAAQQAKQTTEYAQTVSQVVSLAREARVFDVGEAIRGEVSILSTATARTAYQMRLLARLTPAVYHLVALSLLIGGLAAANALEVGDIPSLGAMVVLLVRAISYGQQINTSIQQCSEMAPYLHDLETRLAVYEDNPVKQGEAPTPSITALAALQLAASYEVDRPVLKDISFEILQGETIGVVGPSGGGKSTLLQILLRLREPDSGVLLVNGLDSNAFDLTTWYAQVSFVPQDNHLLPGSVADNIRFFRPSVSDADVERAASLAHLHEDVLAMPRGYDTRIGSGAMDLSGGQKQRLGLARALATRPRLLILDEPTSALDMRSEALIQQTLADLKGTTTCLIVAHRLSTLASCDRVMVLEAGRITAFGPANEVRGVNRFFNEAVELSRGSS